MVIGKRALIVSIFLLLSSFLAVLAHMGDSSDTKSSTLVDQSMVLKEYSLWSMGIIGLFVFILILVILSFDHRMTSKEKWFFFLAMSVPLVMATVYAAGTTLYVNAQSTAGGPVHWHADFELWKCGEKIDLQDPTGISNRVGSSLFHEHGDDRIHVEGVVLNNAQITLHHFFEMVGGELTATHLVVPTNNGLIVAENGETCYGLPGKVQVFVYSILNPDETKKWVYQQHKIKDINAYLVAPFSQVPPGDCIIVEFDAEKEQTDKICSSYQVAQERGELHGS